jgi:phage-related protein
MNVEEKDIAWIGDSRDILRGFPEEVREDIGVALYDAQKGQKSGLAKPLKGFGGASVLEIVADFYNNTYRAVYTVRFKDLIYVLHCFQKKSTHGIKTSQNDIRLIKQRLKTAEEDYKNYSQDKK